MVYSPRRGRESQGNPRKVGHFFTLNRPSLMRKHVRYHGYGDPDSKIVTLEMEEMKASISTNGSDKKWWDFRELYGHHLRTR